MVGARRNVYSRLGLRYRRTVRALLVIAAFVPLIAWFTLPLASGSQLPISVVVAGEPMAVFSLEKSGRATLITLPSGVAVAAVYGYGTYSLEALWQLGTIEKKGGQLLSASLSESLAVPLAWYIARRSGEASGIAGLADLKRFFSPGAISRFLTGQYQTNLSLPRLVKLVSSVQGLTPDRLTAIDLRGRDVYRIEELPDGSQRKIIDSAKIDETIGSAMELEEIRREALAVAIYNTTEVPALGNRVARLLSRLGVIVVTTSNETPEVNECEVSGNKAAISTKTARLIIEFYRCRVTEKMGDGRADLELRIGTSYASRFL